MSRRITASATLWVSTGKRGFRNDGRMEIFGDLGFPDRRREDLVIGVDDAALAMVVAKATLVAAQALFNSFGRVIESLATGRGFRHAPAETRQYRDEARNRI